MGFFTCTQAVYFKGTERMHSNLGGLVSKSCDF